MCGYNYVEHLCAPVHIILSDIITQSQQAIRRHRFPKQLCVNLMMIVKALCLLGVDGYTWG